MASNLRCCRNKQHHDIENQVILECIELIDIEIDNKYCVSYQNSSILNDEEEGRATPRVSGRQQTPLAKAIHYM